MRNAWSDADAAAAVAKWGERHGADLALRTYSSRLLGAEPALVLHGGGNTSVKTTVVERAVGPVEVLAVKGSGWDLATIEPRGFPVCRLERLRRAASLDAMTDEEMVTELRGQMLDPASPTPSVEALLHACLSAKYVDHTHADAVLSVVDRPGSAQHVAEIWEGRAYLLPYVMPGFVLARAIRERLADIERHDLLVLDKHGIFTWGATAEESYRRMIDAVSRAEAWLARGRRVQVALPASAGDADRDAALAKLAPIVRGAIRAASGVSFGPVVATSHADVRRWIDAPGAEELTARGPATPDHVIRTRPFPLFLGGAADLHGDALFDRVAAGARAWAERYDAFVDRGVAARGVTVKRLDRAPRVVLVPGLGALALGATVADAAAVRDLVEHTARVVCDVEDGGEPYTPVTELDVFDMEYWSLEQAKLARTAAAPLPLTRKLALVTGAARGIGRAIAETFLGAGAHVLLVDRDEAALAETARELAGQYAGRVASHACDLTDPAGAPGAVHACLRAFGGLDVVVSNAGNAPTGLLHTAAGEAALVASLSLNLLSHQYLARAAADVWLSQRTGGALLFNASKSAFNQGPDFGPYAVPKTALVALMRQYAVDMAPHGIRANAVNADRIRTDLFGGGVLEARAKARGVSVDDYFRANLLRRETTGEDVARAFLYLATADATTGCVLTVDGGNAAAFPR